MAIAKPQAEPPATTDAATPLAVAASAGASTARDGQLSGEQRLLNGYFCVACEDLSDPQVNGSSANGAAAPFTIGVAVRADAPELIRVREALAAAWYTRVCVRARACVCVPVCVCL